MNPLRVLLVADMEPNRDSGAAGTDMEVADELERQGHDVVRRWSDSFPHRIRHWNLYHLIEQPAAMKRLVVRELERRSFDVVQVTQPAGWAAARELRRRARGERGALFAHRSHGFEPRVGAVVERWRQVYPEDRRPWLRRQATRWLGRLIARNYRGIVRWADLHVVSCGECAADLVARGVSPNAVLVSPQVPTEALLSAPVAPLDDRRFQRVLVVGQHVFFKAPMITAAVLGRLLAADPGLEVTWVCEERDHAAVRARFPAELAARVRLLGWRPRAELARLYDTHGVFLFASFTEGFGKVFLEAMARGLAVVSTEQGGARDLIRSGENGLLAPVGDVDALAAAIELLRRDRDLARRLAQAGRFTAEQFTWRRIVEELVAFYAARLETRRAV